MKIKFAAFVAGVLATAGIAHAQSAKADHLVLTEMLIDSPGTEAVGDILEYIEIYNPTDATISLEDYCLTDVADYWLLPAYMKDDPSGQFDSTLIPDGQHIIQFPLGSELPAGGVAVVTWVSSRFVNDFFGGDLSNFTNQPGSPQLFETLPASAEIPDMITYKAPSEGQEYSISKANGADLIVLFKWDGESDLVSDVDMVSYGGHAGPTPKTGVAVEGPDPDTIANTYNNEPNDFSNLDMELPGAPNPDAIYRTTLLEPGEDRSGGNGLNGHAEVMEVTVMSWAPKEPGQTIPPLTPGTTSLGLASADVTPVPYDAQRQTRYPSTGNTIQILARVADDAESALSVSLVYSVAGGADQTVAMTATANPDEFTANIGPFNNDKTEITYYIEATDATGSAVFPINGDTDAPMRKIFLVEDTTVNDSQLMINEIYYDVFGSGEEGEFVELYNNTAVDQPVGGFVIRDEAGNFGQLPPGAVVPADGYLVMTNNPTELNARYPQPVPNLFTGNTGYNNGGDTLYVLHVNDYTFDGLDNAPAIDTVVYDDVAPWPTDGNAPSPKTIELNLPSLDNNVGENWSASIPDNGTPGAVNSTQWPASVGNWTFY